MIHPVSSQTEIVNTLPELENSYSINVEHKNMYVVFRPGEHGKRDCVVGTTYQPGNSSQKPNAEDQQTILNNDAVFSLF